MDEHVMDEHVLNENEVSDHVLEELAALIIEKMVKHQFIIKPHLDMIRDDYGFFSWFADFMMESIERIHLPDGERMMMLGGQALGCGMHVALRYGPCIEERFIPDIMQDLDGKNLLELAVEDYDLGENRAEAGRNLAELVMDVSSSVLRRFPETDQDRNLLRRYMEVLFDAGATIVNEVERHRQEAAKE